jgi:coproporphyrinogen III oxidase-like Fe-S oxidoreductase
VPAKDFALLLRRPDLAETPNGVLRVSNTRDFRSYLGGEETLWGLGIELVKPVEFLLENLMMGLRLSQGISTASLERRFSRSFDEMFPGLWEKWCAEGYAEPPVRSLRLTESGRMVLDGLLAELADRIAEEDLQQLAVCWP